MVDRPVAPSGGATGLVDRERLLQGTAQLCTTADVLAELAPTRWQEPPAPGPDRPGEQVDTGQV